MRRYKKSDLIPGLLIKDIDSGDLGLLVRRFDIMRDWNYESVWVWDMYWSGPTTDYENRYTPFIEEVLLGLLNSDEWVIVENEDE